ncbi:MAG: biotin--[acetyl-CoA-carboxylase] ligase [Desulfobacterium sp.]|nr:biotin--[acetyl-CoA-carboxylase] ligase [Desulfobacterium sp.]
MGNRETLLHLLKADPQNWISGEVLRQHLGISRNAVSKHIRALRATGYEIQSAPRKGYLLQGIEDRIIPEEIRDGLGTSVFGKQEIRCFTETDSTSLQARLLADDGAGEGALILAESQTRGRGRKGRTWFTPKGEGIFMSMILRPPISPMDASRLTLLTAVALAEALIDSTGLDIRIKWPNDILCKGKKLAGILTELTMEMDAVNHVIIGLGLNVNTPKESFPEELKGKASSILAESGISHSRCKITQRFLERFERHYNDLLSDGFPDLLDRWKALSDTIGQRVCVEMIGKSLTGTIRDMDPNGFLVLEDENGVRHRILSGDLMPLTGTHP